MSNLRTLAIFVPARLNSERLPNKQILPLGDTCMFDICCQKLEEISGLYHIPTYVLVYEKELIDIAKKYPSVRIIVRDEATINTDGPLQFIYKDVKDIPESHLMFLNPCPIFLSVETIVKACDDFMNSSQDYGTSVKKFMNWTFNEYGEPQTPIDYTRLTTKEVTGLYQCAHCFHIFSKEQFFSDGYMLKSGHMILKVPEEETVDIDNKGDYEYARYLWEKVRI